MEVCPSFVYIRMCASEGWMLGLLQLLPTSLEMKSSHWPRAQQSGLIGSAAASRFLPVPPQCRGCRSLRPHLAFSLCAGALNSIPQAPVTDGSFPTEPRPRPSIVCFQSVCFQFVLPAFEKWSLCLLSTGGNSFCRMGNDLMCSGGLAHRVSSGVWSR